jgi:hypothetical protein
MCRIHFLILIMALSVPAWSSCEARGSFPKSSPVLVTPPEVHARDIGGGCVKGHGHNAQVHGCPGHPYIG